MAAKRLTWKKPLVIAGESLVFLVGLGVALSQDWSTVDMVWTFWLASFLIGYLTIAATVGDEVIRPRAARPGSTKELRSWPVRLIFGLGELLFMTLHFGIFHLAYGAFLFQFLPPLEDGESIQALPAALLGFLPLVAVLAVGKREEIGNAIQKRNFFWAYRNVTALALLVLLFGYLAHQGSDHPLAFAAVYLLFFAPWRVGGTEG